MSKYRVALDEFTGPLDLLLHLVRKAEMDLFDLDVSKITFDYLDFIEREGVHSLEEAYQFLAMASTLVELKSRMLLPQQPSETDGEGEDEDDPRMELAQKLAAYEGIQAVTGELAERYEEVGRHWPRNVVEQLETEIVYSMDSLSVYDLMSAFGEVLARPRFKQITIFREDYDVDEARGWLRARLKGGETSLVALLSEQPDVMALIVTFIALLDMIKEEELTYSRTDGILEIALADSEVV